MEKYMTWCVRFDFSLGDEGMLTLDTPVDTYREVIMIPENVTVN